MSGSQTQTWCDDWQANSLFTGRIISNLSDALSCWFRFHFITCSFHAFPCPARQRSEWKRQNSVAPRQRLDLFQRRPPTTASFCCQQCCWSPTSLCAPHHKRYFHHLNLHFLYQGWQSPLRHTLSFCCCFPRQRNRLFFWRFSPSWQRFFHWQAMHCICGPKLLRRAQLAQVEAAWDLKLQLWTVIRRGGIYHGLFGLECMFSSSNNILFIWNGCWFFIWLMGMSHVVLSSARVTPSPREDAAS